MSIFNLQLLDSLNLLEIWLLIDTLLLLLLAFKFNKLILCFIPMSATLTFGIALIFLTLLVIFSPNHCKEGLTLSITNHILDRNLKLEYCGNEWDNLDENSILIINYPTNFIEYLLLPMKLKKDRKNYKIVRQNTATYWPSIYLGSTVFMTINTEKSFEDLNQKIKNLKDTILLVYPERNIKKRSTLDEIQPFKTGIFSIASSLNKKIFIVYVPQIDHVCGFITTTELRIKIRELNNYDAKEAFNLMNLLKEEEN